MKLSLILPLHNAEKDLPALLENLFSQKRREEWEIVAVDDASTDRSPALLEEAARTHPELRFFTVPHGGPAAARQAGMAKATGDYFLFCDADDRFLPGAFETVENALSEKPDLLLFGYVCSVSPDAAGDPYLPGEAFSGGRVAFARRLGALFARNQINQVWGKAFSAALLRENGIAFPDRFFGEDRLFLYRAISAAKTFSCLDAPLYRYVTGKETLVSRFLPEKGAICAELDGGIRELFSAFGVWNEENAALCDYMFVKSILSCLVTLYSPSCPLKRREKRRWVREIFALPEMKRAHRFPPDCGRAFRILARILKTENVTLSLFAARMMKAASRLSPRLFRRAKHSYNNKKTGQAPRK